MEKAIDSSKPKASHGVEDDLSNEAEELLLTLPREKNFDGTYLYQFNGVWYRHKFLYGMISTRRHFQARDSDIIVSTFPKSGTTWLKALTYAIVHRSRCAFEHSPLLTTNPHELVPFFEISYSLNKKDIPSFEHLYTPRIFGTHIPYSTLPDSIVNSNCRIVYICRNPLDQFISCWHFLLKLAHDKESETLSLEEYFEKVCNGVQHAGPFWEHVLGYWKASLDNSHKILFLKYEDLKEDTHSYVKKLAEFLGCPFSNVEEKERVIEEIVKLCSFENMKDLEVNKPGRNIPGHIPKNSDYFRKGEVGDWTNYLTPSMSKRLKNLMEEKFSGSGLAFKLS
ncbi:hypothetical protein EZV62_026162 [Acer yangbiense]|uniref:Sulfotransferase n=1 Tax=Acer yangbiense TaxID=1000413 RepID=A0A5C7GQD5_9ROSI|nr:hypothetical protein EZV62_026162 [Acer yangbiense]